MAVKCPKCGSRKLRASTALTIAERVMRWLGVYQIRCRECDERFRNVIYDIPNMLYCRCPKCFRLELTSWNPENYNVPGTWTFLMKLGAKRRRCDACRCNFLSFRPKKGGSRRHRTAASRSSGLPVNLNLASD